MLHSTLPRDATQTEIETEMARLSALADRACIPSTEREIRADQDELVGRWLKAASRAS